LEKTSTWQFIRFELESRHPVVKKSIKIDMDRQNITHNYSIFKRLSSLTLLILCVIIGVNLYFMHSQNAAKWYAVESEQLGRSLTLQAAQLIAAPLAKKDQEMLLQYVSVINKGMFVKGAVLFDDIGVRFAQEDERFSVVDMLKNSDIEPLVFVEDVVFEENIIGYIKLVLDKKEITEHHREFNKNQFSQSVLIIVLSVIASALATRVFYKVRKSYRLVDSEDEAR
jgi:membrane protein